ncbi:MAG TPA: hypothetical protein VNO70_25590 [Blastocatellia bacterium]|nr:hypothetical protein [Blastocatellia bacterium]
MSSDDQTKKLSEDTLVILSRLDAIDARLTAFEKKTDERLTALEQQALDTNERLTALEAKALDTKPIWEKALAEIAGFRTEQMAANEKFERWLRMLTADVGKLRVDQEGLEARMDKLEGSQA